MLFRLIVLLSFFLLVSCDTSTKLDVLSLFQPEKACAVNLLIEINDGLDFIKSKRIDSLGELRPGPGGLMVREAPPRSEHIKFDRSELYVLKNIDVDECAADVRAAMRDYILVHEAEIQLHEEVGIDREFFSEGEMEKVIQFNWDSRKARSRLADLINKKYFESDE